MAVSRRSTRWLAKPAAPDKLEPFFTSRVNHTDNAFREPLAIARSCTLSPQLRAPQSLAEEAEAAHPVRSWEAADHALQCPMLVPGRLRRLGRTAAAGTSAGP